jgi:hypothetical protein
MKPFRSRVLDRETHVNGWFLVGNAPFGCAGVGIIRINGRSMNDDLPKKAA